MPYTLTVNFTLASPNPGSYRVKYWPTSNPASITTVLVSTSPFVAYDLPESSYAGTIESSCGNNTYSTPISFSGAVSGSFTTLATHYTPCTITTSGAAVSASEIYLAPGVTDIGPGVTLYTSSAGTTVHTTITLLSAFDGKVYNVGANGIVGSYTGNTC